MAVRVGDHARLVWGSLNGRDFAAVEDLIAELIELDEQQRIEDLDVAASVDAGLYDVEVVLAGYMTAASTTETGVMVYALGRPT